MMFKLPKEYEEALKRFLDEINIKKIYSSLSRFSPAELSILATIIGLLFIKDLTGRETVVIASFIKTVGEVALLEGQQKLLLEESVAAKLDKEYVNEDDFKRQIEILQYQLNQLNKDKSK